VAGYVIARLAWAVVLFFAITMVTFIIFFVLPQPQTRGPGLGGQVTQGESDLRQAFRLEGPVLVQYGQYTWRFVRHGSLGRSYFDRQQVMDKIRRTAPVTLSLVLGGALVWLLIAIPVGIVSALRPRSLVDRGGMVFVLVGVSAHPAWLSLILVYGLGFKLGWFPVGGYCDLFSPQTSCGGPTQWAYHLLLPWFAIALLFAALYARMIRASVLETLDDDYVRTARAKGAGTARVLRSHVLRNAMLPVVTMLGMDIGLFLTNAIFVETVFGLPGVGGMLRQSITRRDLPVIVGVVMFTTTVILILNLIVDLVYARIDPRIQTREGVAAHSAATRRLRRRATVPVRASATTN
jgi:peptide/nickel transport system permease protein